MAVQVRSVKSREFGQVPAGYGVAVAVYQVPFGRGVLRLGVVGRSRYGLMCLVSVC